LLRIEAGTVSLSVHFATIDSITLATSTARIAPVFSPRHGHYRLYRATGRQVRASAAPSQNAIYAAVLAALMRGVAN